MKCTILGCGGSLGTPEIGCSCFTCTSDNPKNKRTRASILIESAQTKLLIDASTDLRMQALSNNLTSIDALFITHAHADHISGLDDLKPMIRKAPKPIPTYLSHNSWDWIKGTYAYLFEENGSRFYRPLLEKIFIPEEHLFTINDMEIQTFPQIHGEIRSLGLRIGNFVYSTDFSTIPESSMKYLKNIDCWIVDCMRFHWSPTHSSYEKTMDLIHRLKPKRAIITHMAHEIEYDSIIKIMPPHVIPAYDGMVIDF